MGMTKLTNAFNVYSKIKNKGQQTGNRYFVYKGKNMMGLDVEDIFSAKDEIELRNKLSKQFITVEEVSEVSQRVYQIYFEKKRNQVVETSHQLALKNAEKRQRALDDGSIDPEEEIENFVSRFKKFTERNK